MPLVYDQLEKFRWTNRCKQWPINWGDKTTRDLYPFGKMQVGDFFLLPSDPAVVNRVQQASLRWSERYRERWKQFRPDKAFPRFSCRPSREFQGAYVCRRVV